MSRFYGEISNSKSTVKKSGGADGLSAHVRGWNVGAAIEVGIGADGEDVVKVYKTSGSNGSGNRTLIVEFKAI